MMESLLERIIHQALDLDPNTPVYLQQLRDQCVRITVQTTQDAYSYDCMFLNERLQVLSATSALCDQKIDASISGSYRSFLSFVLSGDSRFALRHGLCFEGNPHTLQILEQWFSHLQIDWAEWMSQWMGDSAAHTVEQGLKQGLKHLRQAAQNSLRQVMDYWVDDQPLITSGSVVNRFFDEVDELRAAVDRLEARLQHSIVSEALVNTETQTCT